MPEPPKSLIINSPYDPPDRHWTKQDTNLQLMASRRPAGYELYDFLNNTLRVEPLPLVNQIRERVGEWRGDGYPGVTSVTRRLLEY